MSMARLIELAVTVFKWAAERPRLALEAFLVFALVGGGWAYNRQAKKLEEAKLQMDGLEANLSEKIKLKDNELIVLRREKGKVKIIRKYVPPEGHVVIKKKDQEALLAEYNGLMKRLLETEAGAEGEREKLRKELEEVIADLKQPSEIEVKNKGFTLKPGFGLEAGRNGIRPRLDLKWGYWNRWSAIAGGSEYGLDVGISRHIDDYMWGRPKNAELYGAYKFLRFDQLDWQATGGIRVNF
jgi:hypothetical protein